MAVINTGAVARTITGVNESDLFLDESSSTVLNTGAVERALLGVNDYDLFLDESNSSITNTGVVIRNIEGVNESDEMFPNNTISNIVNVAGDLFEQYFTPLRARAQFFENEEETRNILAALKSCVHN